MLYFLNKYSAILLMFAGVIGFSFPSISRIVFPALPYILFFLMLFTLLGIKQELLIRKLLSKTVWSYALFHSLGLTLFAAVLLYIFNISTPLFIAITAVTATGTLFATPAIAKTLGYDVLHAMALTIASTLMMPIVLFFNLMPLQSDTVTLDFVQYIQRLTIFIIGPMAISAFCYKMINPKVLQKIHNRISKLTVLLIFAFPLGLVAPLREMFERSLHEGMSYLLLGCLICGLFFGITYLAYYKSNQQSKTLYAITATNRNVLLTYTIASSYLGFEYLALMAAIQIPTYALPVIIKLIAKTKFDHQNSFVDKKKAD
ncbi:hypothetical protein [Photobacterium angustum]|uniref:hypothetical protein n=1 Tax=Photobacterium angustum TaxID=661 RepID=UPI0005DD9BF3|nr:hypothetical protein [Photobacterium angustum]KJF96212.1 membrane protein [Photobacterium angustum]PSW82348.1 hypothetical protein CTN03_04040 [Photobacterium angustum]